MNDLISIVIPCYNAGKTLARTLNSVLLQDYKNLEIIMINDGSTDNTAEVACRFVERDNRFKLINQENAGVGAARNNGIRHATGRYLMFLDADDNYTTPYAISKMEKGIREFGADMFVFSFIHPCFDQYLGTGVYDMTDPDQFLKFYQDFFALGMPWNKIYKRECITEDFVEGVKFTEDEIFNDYNLHNMKKVALTSEVLHNYYCAPYNPKAKASAVNSLYSADKFWEKKCTIWHMGMLTNKYRYYAIDKWFADKKEDLQYIRSFDFFFWDFFLMAKNCVKEEHIAETLKGIFKEQLFLDSIKSKEKYGLKLKNYTEQDIDAFVNNVYYAFKEVKFYYRGLSMYKVALSLFGIYFYDLVEDKNTVEILSKTYKELKANSTKEALYVNKLLQSRLLEEGENNCKILVINKQRKKITKRVED